MSEHWVCNTNKYGNGRPRTFGCQGPYYPYPGGLSILHSLGISREDKYPPNRERRSDW